MGGNTNLGWSATISATLPKFLLGTGKSNYLNKLLIKRRYPFYLSKNRTTNQEIAKIMKVYSELYVGSCRQCESLLVIAIKLL